MSRAIPGLVALLIPAAVLAGQATDQTQTFVVQGPDGAIGVGAVQTVIQAPNGTVFVPPQGEPLPARDAAQPPKTGTSRIRGRAVAADSGQPLRRALIRLTSPDLRDMRTTSTDAEGRYEFRELPAARYTLSASKNGYVTTSYGARTGNQGGRVLTLGERQEADRVDFSVPRGGVITGRVIDEFGDPAVGVNVQPVRSQVINGQRNDVQMGQMATTSDTGEFRIWGLMPGEYRVMASPLRMFGGPNETSDDRTGYAATYFPGTASAAEAQGIAVVAGQVASGVDIMLSPTRTATVSGSAADASGQPARRGNVTLMPKSGPGMFMGMAGGGQIRADGTFTILNVAPGDYTVRGTIPPSGPGVPAEQLTASISVAGADLTGVLLAPLRQAKITGRITLDPPGTWVDWTGIRVMVQPKAPGPFNTAGFTQPVTKDDFTFEASSGPGAMLVRAFPSAPGGAAWMLKSVRYDGREIIDTGLDLSEGRDAEGVEIVITNRQQVVMGAVTNAKGEPVLDASVTFFSQNPDDWTGPTRRIGAARPDQNGRYSVRTLPPGDYFAVATESADMSQRATDPKQFYEDLSRVAIRLTLLEGDSRTLDLKVVVQP